MENYRILLRKVLIVIFISFSYQVAADELLVPLDSAGKLFIINSELSKQLNLFTEYENLVEAKLFKTDDNLFFLEIIYKSNNQSIKSRKQLSEVDVEELRKKITNAIYSGYKKFYLNQEGRTDFLINTAIISLFFWGPSVPIMLEIKDLTTATGLSLISSGICFILPYSFTENSEVTNGMSTFANNGAWLGLGHGALIALLIGGKNVSVQGFYGGLLLGSISELIINYNIARINNFSDGKSWLISNYSAIGAAYGVYLSGLFDFFNDPSPSPASGTILLMSGMGYLSGALISNTQNYTSGDAEIKINSWLLATALPVSILIATETTEMDAYWASMAIGGLGGLILGNELVRGYDFETTHGKYNTLATFGGGLIGAGIGSMVSSSEKDKIRYMPLLATVFGGIGYYLTYSAFKNYAKIEPKTSGLDIEFNPTYLLVSKIIKKNEPISIPLISLKYRF